MKLKITFDDGTWLISEVSRRAQRTNTKSVSRFQYRRSRGLRAMTTQLLTGPEAVAAMHAGEIVTNGAVKFRWHDGGIESCFNGSEAWRHKELHKHHVLLAQTPQLRILAPAPAPSRLDRAIEDYCLPGQPTSERINKLGECFRALKEEIIREVKG